MIHHVYSERILKKPFLLKCLYILRYALVYPCKNCIVKMICRDGCKPLAQYTWIYHQIIHHIEIIIDIKYESKVRKVLRFFYVAGTAFPIMSIMALHGVPIKKLLQDEPANEDFRFSYIDREFFKKKDDP